jgi:hypothetical protein
MSEKPTEKPAPASKPVNGQVSKPIRPNPNLDQLVEKGGPTRVPRPEWLKKLAGEGRPRGRS